MNGIALDTISREVQQKMSDSDLDSMPNGGNMIKSINISTAGCHQERQTSTSDPKTSSDSDAEVKYLREMSLLNLDVIHRQYELIQSKDKQIKSLKSDREALKCRLERMERRMSILRQHQEVQEKLTRHVSPSCAQPHTQDKGKRKSTFEPQNLSKKFAPNTSRERHDSTDSARSTRSNQSKQKPHSTVPKSNRGRPLANAKQSSAKTTAPEIASTPENKPSRIRHLSPEEANTNCNSRNSDKTKTVENSDDVLRTDFSYYSPSQYDKPELRSKKVAKEKVEVPTWKILTFTNCYQLEGTENLEDEIFLKRHQKPEKEEIRRKRWDLQRLREQRMYEKLQLGRYASKLKKQIKEEDREPETFAPKLEDAHYIEVSEQIPVTAFGYPIPSITPSEFSLPWSEKTGKSNNAKSTPRKR